jgi:hypothetical protein
MKTLLCLTLVPLANRANSFRSNDEEEEEEEEEETAPPVTFVLPAHLPPVGRDLSMTRGDLKWSVVEGPTADVIVRWCQGRLFVALPPDNCPAPLSFFIRTDTNFSKRREHIRKHNLYCEMSEGKQKRCVLEWDALILLLEIRNTGLGICSPAKEKHADTHELHDWQHFARQLPYRCSPESLGYDDTHAPQTKTARTKRNELGQSNRKAKHAGRKKLSSHTRLQQVAQTFAELSTAQHTKLAKLFTECQKEGMTYALDEWAAALHSPDRRLPLHLLTRITNQSAKRIRALQSGMSATECVDEKQQRAQRKQSKIPTRFRTHRDDDGGEQDISELVEDIVDHVAESVWSSHDNLKDQYPTLRVACDNEFDLSKQCRGFWQEVWEEVNGHDDLPAGVLGVTTLEHERAVLVAIFEHTCDSEFTKLNQREHYQLRLQHPDGWSVAVPNLMEDYGREKREKDLRERSVGAISLAGPVVPLEHSEENPIRYCTELRTQMAPDQKLTDVNTLLSELDKGTCGALALGAERQVVVEQNAPRDTELEDAESDDDEIEPTFECSEKLLRWVRIADTTTLVVQWAMQNAGAFLGEGSMRITVAIELWLDGTSIGGRPSVAAYMKMRPIGNASVGDGPDAADKLMDATKKTAYLKDRLLLLADDTRETREVYETIIRLLCAQLRATVNSSLPLKLSSGRTITLDLQVEPIRGDFHAQQAWNGLNMAGAWTCPYSFVRAASFGDFTAFCDQIERKLELTPGRGMNDWQDIYDIAIAWEKYKRTGEAQDLGYVMVGGKDSQVHGAAPCFIDAAVLKTRPNRDPSQLPESVPPPTLERLGFKFKSLAPDCEHCMHATIKAIWFEFANKLPGKGKTALKAKVKEFTGRDTYVRLQTAWRPLIVLSSSHLQTCACAGEIHGRQQVSSSRPFSLLLHVCPEPVLVKSIVFKKENRFQIENLLPSLSYSFSVCSWRTLCSNYKQALLPVLAEYGGAVPEATVLFHRLKQIDEIVHLQRADLTRHDCLRCKLACFEYGAKTDLLSLSRACLGKIIVPF